MKYFFIILILLVVVILISCQTEKEKQTEKINELQLKAKVSKSVDSLMKNIGSDIFQKALSLKDSCPVSIQSAKVYKADYSKAYRITYKNTGSKTIDALKFMLYGENNWGEAEKVSFLGTAYTYAEVQSILKPGKATSNSWTISTGDPTKMKAVVLKIHFTDGAVWSVE